MPNAIVIVGAGFCGTVLAANLLRKPPTGASHIVLVERGPAMGRGVAYAAREFPYLLNVPAARLSADSRDPLQFLRFAQRRAPGAGGEDFLPRSLYGDYLEDLLSQAERSAPAHIRLVRIFDEVRRITAGSGDKPLAAHLKGRPPIMADLVILALGNPSAPLLPWAAAIRDHESYLHDPRQLPPALAQRSSVLIVGNGLTMVDAAVALSHDAARPTLHTISRRGLVPLSQTPFRQHALRGDGESFLACADSLRRVLSMTRELSREVESRGGDWREAVTFVRHLAPTLWHRLPLPERRRFVRHLQQHWDIHRHRLPPPLAARIEYLRSIGKLHVNAGRIESIAAAGRQLQVAWRPRAGTSRSELRVDLVVNATGPDYVLKRCADPLLNSLRAAGMVSEDALDLGLRTGRYGACVDSHGRASESLYYLGPMLRADHWEATAATELRDHAERLAEHLGARLAAVPRE